MDGIIRKLSSGEYEFGEFEDGPKTIQVYKKGSSRCVWVKNLEIVKDDVFYSLMYGKYLWKEGLSSYEIKKLSTVMGVGLYPYTFDRAYEAVNHFDLFAGKQTVDTNFVFLGAHQIKYTFGLEYETSMGCIPEWLCFHDGLIPLRDGSISGPEYSSVVMAGNSGVNLMYQQLKTLRSHTAFNKECSLHMHLGGYPVNKTAIFTLYSLCSILENSFFQLCNKYVVRTSKYKKSGKDYCTELNHYNDFNDMYTDLVGMSYEGSLTAPHPADINRGHKWNIHGRYHDINFINMLCYQQPKTVEFRFLRPSYNFTKVYTWLLIFNAVMLYAEELSKFGSLSPDDLFEKMQKTNLPIKLKDIIKRVYDSSVSKVVIENISNLLFVAQLQESNEDFIGADTSFEDSLMTDSYH